MKLSTSALALALLGSSSWAAPNFHACVEPDSANTFGFCDPSLSIDERVADLRNRLSLEEKVYMTQPQEKFGNMCGTTTGEMDRLGIPQYTWLIETNTNVASSCMEDGRCATTFVGPEGMGASFNKTSWFMKGSVFGNEMRAYNNINWHRSTNSDHDPPYDYIGVTGFGPNINLARDPRFGRNSELPGEDPLLSGTYGSQMTQGMQEEDANGHPKMISYLKHLTAYSTETNRGHDNYIISDHDLWESYLPAFEKAFVEGGSSGAMCSYNAINGAPSCANEYILTDVVRGMWSPDAHVTSDCGAISNLMGDPVNAPSAEAAASMAMNAGTDIDMGSATMTDHLANATNIGMVDEATLDASFDRSMKVLFRAGRFDPVDSIEWSTFGKETVNSTEHQQISYEAALQSMVLLRNDDNVLPLKSGVSVAVVGPMANDPSRYLSSYAADEICFGGDHHCMTSLADAIAVNNGADKTASADGCDVDSDDESGFDEALDIAKDADVVVLALGIDNSVEYEGVDRTDTSLPGVQSKFGQAVLALGKPVILTLFNGGALAIDELMEGPSAIIEGFNPAVLGPKALSDQMFGLENRWGKLPITMYPHDFIEKVELTDYQLAAHDDSVGRTYRYYIEEPLFKFGHGLSLTKFEMSCSADGDAVECEVENVGSMDGDEVVQMYHVVGDDVKAEIGDAHPVFLRALVGFERVRVGAGETQKIKFDVPDFKIVNEDGDKVLYSGTHSLIFSRGVGDDEEEVEIDFQI